MFCSSCGTRNDDSAKFCQKCGQTLTAVPAGTTAPQPTTLPPSPDPRMRGAALPSASTEKQYVTGKNPVVAVILSVVIPGCGQFYNRDKKKGAIMLAGWFVLSILTMNLAELSILVHLGMRVWSAIDAHRVASGKAPLW